MFKLKQSLVAFAGVLAIIGLIALLTPGTTRGQGSSGNAPPTFDVNVVNTEARPVPVRDVDNPVRQPFLSSRTVNLPSVVVSNSISFDPIPAGKQLVVEYVSAQCRLPLGQSPAVRLRGVTAGGTSTDIAYPIFHHQFTVPAGFENNEVSGDWYQLSEEVRLYPPVGGGVRVEIFRNLTGGDGVCTALISGHLVDVPQQ